MSISTHPHPQPRRQRLVEIIAALALLGVIIGTLGLLIIGIAYKLILMLLMIPFLLGLSASLLLLTSLHPQITVEEEGLWLKPLVFRRSFVQWQDLRLVKHTLISPPPPSKFKTREAQEGEMLQVPPSKLPKHYCIVGLIAGYGFTPIFAISNRTHLDYKILRDTLKKQLK